MKEGEIHAEISCHFVLVAGHRRHEVAGQTDGRVQLSPNALSFGNQVVGTVSNPQIETVTVQSTSAAGVTFGNIAITGRNAADFTVQSDTCSGKQHLHRVLPDHDRVPPFGGRRTRRDGQHQLQRQRKPAELSLAGTGIPVTLTSIAIAPVDARLVSGSQLQLTAQGIYNDGTQKDITNDGELGRVPIRESRRSTRDWRPESAREKPQSLPTLRTLEAARPLRSSIRSRLRIQPAEHTPVGKAISPGVRVEVRDNGSPVENLAVTIDLGPNPPNPAELTR